MGSEKCKCPPAPTEIPKWFVTYSDVITLLMTFFILLLTFASSEPEDLEKMQAATFGPSGTEGLAGQPTEGQDKNSLVVRYRPNSARSTGRGSETAPTEKTPIGESASKGLDALENPDELASAERVSTVSFMAAMRDKDGHMTPKAIQQLRLIAVQMRSLPLSADFQVSEKEGIEFAVGIARYMQDQLKVPSGRLSVSVGSTASANSTIRTTLTRVKD